MGHNKEEFKVLQTPTGTLSEQLRIIADNIDKVWAPQARLGDDDQTEPRDAKVLREIADHLE